MLRLHPVRKTYSADIKHRTFGRVHLGLQTKVKDAAMRRHTALRQLLDTGEPVRDVVEALRARKLTIQAVEECARAKLPFDTLRPSTWPTLGDAITSYVEALGAKEGGSEKTTANASAALAHALAFFGTDRRLESITHDEVAAFKVSLLAVPLHANTVGLYLTKFGALYTYLQKRETKRAAQQKRTPATLFSPLDRDEVPDFQQTRVRYLSEPEAELVLAATPESLKLAVALGLFAGLRVGEISMLRPIIDVNPERSIVFIQKREGWQPKYGRNREVPISSALEPYVDAHLARLPDGAPYVFPGMHPGRPLSVHQIQHVFTRVVEDAGLIAGREHPEGVTPHTLRHSFASWLVMAGADLLTIARLMGHKTIKQVVDTYGHLSPGHLLVTVELLSTRWFARPATGGSTPPETP